MEIQKNLHENLHYMIPILTDPRKYCLRYQSRPKVKPNTLFSEGWTIRNMT